MKDSLYLVLTFFLVTNNGKKLPDWKDLDIRPLPPWYDSAKIGIFIHWGLYSVPSFKDEWFWYWFRTGESSVQKFMDENYHGFEYKDFADMFKAKSFDPDEWAELFARSGAKYVVLTTKHHDGFALFQSNRSNWNSVDVGPNKDIVDSLSRSVRKHDMKFGMYYAIYEWFNELFANDKNSNLFTTEYTDTVVWPDIKYLINKYKPSLLWSDDGYDVARDTYWKAVDLLTWLYNESPVKDEIVVNDRWGNGTECRHGDFYNCGDRFHPKKLKLHKWENAFPLDVKSWGYRRDMQYEDVMSIEKLLETVVSTVSCGGNALINVGPMENGTIPHIFRERLLELGNWLDINGEAIYNTTPWHHQMDSLNSNVWYTCTRKKFNTSNSNFTIQKSNITAVYAIFLQYPSNKKLQLKDLSNFMNSSNHRVEILKLDGYILTEYEIVDNVVTIDLPDITEDWFANAWTVKISMGT